ncbi:sulfite exporter TauE/SafE family protein [Rossellomorea marisflavi]|nr:sulfite exporter TauE/SafE family protein [Rossellomorea marisflavi]
MAFGLTSSTLLLAYGVAPAIASASIHMSEIATTAASGMAHWKFGNVNKRMALLLMIPGSISAFIGAAFLSSIPGEAVRPYISSFLLLLGLYIFIRFLFWPSSSGDEHDVKPAAYVRKRILLPLGATAGFFDAIGGGGWGPINTPVLLSRKEAVPREVIGTVDTSEFAVTLSATLGFILFLGWGNFDWQWVAAFVIGGVAAAPIAALLVKKLPSFLLGVLVGGFIILTNSYTLLTAFNQPSTLILVVCSVILFMWILGVIYSLKGKRLKKNR